MHTRWLIRFHKKKSNTCKRMFDNRAMPELNEQPKLERQAYKGYAFWATKCSSAMASVGSDHVCEDRANPAALAMAMYKDSGCGR